MHNFEVVRHTTKLRKRSLKCKIIFVAILSLIGYALAFSLFSPVRPKDIEVDQNNVMKREGMKLDYISKGYEIEQDPDNVLTPPNDTNVKVLGADEIHNKTKPEELILKAEVGIMQNQQEVTRAVHNEVPVNTQQNGDGDGQNGRLEGGVSGVGGGKKTIEGSRDEQNSREIVKSVSFAKEPPIETKVDKPVQKKRQRKKLKAAGTKPQELVNIQKDQDSHTPNPNDILKAEVEAKKAQISLLSQPIINFHDFEYIRNPVNACADSRTEVLFIVPSAPENFQRRADTRNSTRGDYVREPSNNARLVFFIGRPACGDDSAKTQSKIDDEFYRHRDIVQENFEDVYKNIRLKAVSMLKWAINFCKDAKFVIRTDDDVTVNVPKIVSIMEAKSKLHTDFIIGNRKDGWKPVRKIHAKFLKYFVSEEEYPEPTYPPFAVGGLLGYPLSTVSLLYQAALRLKPLWLDDVFITGICAVRLQVPLLKDPDFVFQHPKPAT